MEVFDENTQNEFNSVYLLHKIPFLNLNILDLAARFKCKLFVAHPISQTILTEIWNDNLKEDKNLVF